MADRLKPFLENPLFVFLTVTGIVVTAVLFVLFCRNRKQDRLTRRRFLLPLVLMLVHTLLLPLAFLSGPCIDILGFHWIALVPVLLIVQILYLVHYRKWDNRDLRIATTALAFYNVPLFFLAFLTFFVIVIH